MEREQSQEQTPGGSGAVSPATAVENTEMAQEHTVSDFGEVEAKRRAVAAERGGERESGDVASEQAYLRRDAQITDEMRDQRAKKANINNAVHD